ncbi:type IV secretion system protein VirB5 [Bartonella krasnovii]|uniref:Type IV secretion system protein VirB5 n=2 Tax=Bartonella krasnovii TaxID=2267275 RepID=A0A5B9D2M1_9HYPH|nr:type IV secretion system protein VirB5 [Bartonella krasnovii]QEE12539.1 type IV secretion system protein VirB5 [Bartonella krasnovii]UNF28727.1 type IV secretion system protein VirB5 [Bartonella krasnovii]UNF35103.1 type IV secretion system protein VirB5 [Bartonella krasnovii]UNF36733.1 type IV secretion system protein VirB5 [Bartonella krasnovii]UNF38276.1 type IV secretion system protein VirB5 [Bartonella krasnovii]
MKKYSLVTLLSFSFIPHALSQISPDADEYYKQALENTQKLDIAKSETAESIYKTVTEKTKKINEIRDQLEQLKAQINTATTKAETENENEKKSKLEELQKLQTLQQELQVKVSLLQADLQANALKLQSLDMIQAKDTKTKEELREEKEQEKHKQLQAQLKEKEEKLKEKLESIGTDVKL